MAEGEDFDPSELTALVVDQNNFQRSIAIDQLRVLGFRRALGATHAAHAWEMLLQINPDVVLIEWLDDGEGGLDLVRKIRLSEEAPNRAVSIFMLTARGAQKDVESARKAGVDGYLRKPITGLALRKRVKSVVMNPQPFIVTATYVGPCRRRRRNPNYDGPWRRLDDTLLHGGDSETRANLARARVAALDAAARTFAPGDARAARRVFKAAQALADVAEQIDDATLSFGCREMMRYLDAHGAAGQLDPDVVRTHVAALHQLAHLPTAMKAERDSVAQSLRRMVDKKLRQAAAG